MTTRQPAPKRGRRFLSSTEPTERITVRLPASYAQYLRDLGDDTVSDAVRRMIEERKSDRR